MKLQVGQSILPIPVCPAAAEYSVRAGNGDAVGRVVLRDGVEPTGRKAPTYLVVTLPFPGCGPRAGCWRDPPCARKKRPITVRVGAVEKTSVNGFSIRTTRTCASISNMEFKQIWNQGLLHFQDGGVLTVGLLTTAVLVIIVGMLVSAWVARLVGRRMRKTRLSPDTVAALQKLIFILLVIVTVLTALSLLQVPLTAFTFMSGAVAIGVGFGAQNVINNYISGWILMSERPVRIGDFIEIDDSKGVVERIGNRSTQIRRVDGVHIMVPNSILMERTLINWTLVDRDIRAMVSVGVAYGSPVREVEKLIQSAVKEHKDIMDTPAPIVVFSEFGDSALIFETYFWCRVSGSYELRQIRSDVRFRIDELFREHGITIAFPQRDVHLYSDKPLQFVAGGQETGGDNGGESR